MPKTDEEPAIEGLAAALVKSADAQRRASIAITRNSRYMFWAVLVAVMSAVITAVSVVLSLLEKPPPYIPQDAEKLVLLYNQPPSGKLVDLDHQEINVEPIQDEEKHIWYVNFFYVIKNVGYEPVNALVIKIYSKHPSLLQPNPSPSSDEPKYLYEAFLDNNGIASNFFPAKLALSAKMNLGWFKNDQINLNNEPLLIKIYYGKDQFARATVFLTSAAKAP
jgi:hypothetical protein